MKVFNDTVDLLENGEQAAMITVVGKEGSAPRDVGARMVVTTEDEYGTIGGGTVEALAIEAAREVLAGREEPGVRQYELDPGGNTGMVCGGEMAVFVDRIQGPSRLYVAGGGHIGQELATMADQLGYEVTVVDDREEYSDPADFPDGVAVIQGNYGEVLRDQPMGADASVAVATRSGTFDGRAAAAAIEGDAGYIGIVASDLKAERIVDSLHDDGYARSELVRVRSPIGLDLGGGTPEDIALSILAEINAVRHGASAKPTTRLDIDDLVVVRGGGDLGSGVAYRFHQAGYPVVVTEVSKPTVVRRAVAFASAMYDDDVEIEGVAARRAGDVEELLAMLEEGNLPVFEDPDAELLEQFDAKVLVDAIMAKGKADTGTRRGDADVVIGLGPGFEAGEDVDAVVETDRGHELGRVIYEGTASPYDGVPGERRGYTHERVLRAPSDGRWESDGAIGDLVEAGDVVGTVGNEPVRTEIDGLIRGLVHDGVVLEEGAKVGDVDPRGEDVDPEKISDKALCLGGGALEAALRLG